MSRKRSTFDVVKLVNLINQRNRTSCCTADARQGWNHILEIVLHETGNYRGFGYLTSNQVPSGAKPGIIRDEQDPVRNVYPDETRRFYHF